MSAIGDKHYHNALVHFDDYEYPVKAIINSFQSEVEQLKSDPRWPTHCHCGYAFVPQDYRQLFVDRLYRLPDGKEVTVEEAPVGAIWRAWWFEESPSWAGPDGQCLIVKTPGGDWCVDGPAKDGSHWKRTGTPPNISVTPSILIEGKYHGFLTDGVLKDT